MADRSNTAGGSGEASKNIPLRPLAIPDAPRIDGLKLLETGDSLMLLFSTQERRVPSSYEMIIQTVPLTNPVRVTRIATVERLLPVPPTWDARITKRGEVELVFELAGGALNALMRQDATGATQNVSAAYPFESFHRPHFVRVAPGNRSADIGAVAERKTVVVFPGSMQGNAPAYNALASGADGLVGGTTARWVVLKTLLSGPSLFDVSPGQLALARASTGRGQQASPMPFPGIIAYEFDAAALGHEVAVFATGTPAALLLSTQPAKPLQFDVPDHRWLSMLSRPTMAVSATHLHFAALAEPGTPSAAVLYGAIPLSALQEL